MSDESNIPPPLAAVPPQLPPEPVVSPPSVPDWLVTLLSLCLGLFLADAVLSFADDSLRLFNITFLGGFRVLIGLFGALIALIVYILMAFVPTIPKKYFVPLALFNLFASMAGILPTIYFYDRTQRIAWVISLCQVFLGAWLLYALRGEFTVHWPLVKSSRLRFRRFSWSNFWAFVLANIFILVPGVLLYFFLCASLAIGHFSEGFMALHMGGLSVQSRTYVRDDKTIRLFPMSHVADADFYQQISGAFPSNSVVLMEGVTDDQNLITNKISYERMAKSLGLAEQHKQFKPDKGKWVDADVDVSIFSKDTLTILNLVMMIHSQGINPGNLQTLMQFSPSPQIQQELIDDLLHKRNHHLLDQVQVWLPKSDYLMIPWGAAHMPELSHEIQKSGFHLVSSQDYQVIRFRF